MNYPALQKQLSNGHPNCSRICNQLKKNQVVFHLCSLLQTRKKTPCNPSKHNLRTCVQTVRSIGQALVRRCADGERLLFKTALNEKGVRGRGERVCVMLRTLTDCFPAAQHKQSKCWHVACSEDGYIPHCLASVQANNCYQQGRNMILASRAGR